MAVMTALQFTEIVEIHVEPAVDETKPPRYDELKFERNINGAALFLECFRPFRATMISDAAVECPLMRAIPSMWVRFSERFISKRPEI